MLVLDTSALLKRYVDKRGSERVIRLMDSDPQWCGSALCVAEAFVTLCQLGFDADVLETVSARLRSDWRRFLVVPVDDLCLAQAIEIGCNHRVRMLDAVHLAAADRLPRPSTFLTFDARQAAAARSLGLDVPDAYAD